MSSAPAVVDAAPVRMVVTQPGVYDLPAEAYHADPVEGGSLSSTGARMLLPPSCPALFQHNRQNPPPTRKVWELGTAAHQLVLGAGAELVLVDRPRWDTNEVKAEIAAIRERGGVPLKKAEWDQVHAMAAALRRHPVAARLFEPGTGNPERTLVWQDAETGVWCRAMLDWLPNGAPGQRLIVPDYKSCLSAQPDKFARAMADHGYHIQLAHYLAGVRALGLGDERATAVLVAQEKNPPYLVSVVQPDLTALRVGEMRIREALRIYADCMESGQWPGYTDDVVPVELPPWETRDLDGSW